MKQLVAILLVLALLTGCSATAITPATDSIGQGSAGVLTDVSSLAVNDPVFLDYAEGVLYQDLIAQFDSDEIFIENIDTVYVSKEYVEESAYNSQSNIYFGYTLDELNAVFEGTRYVFTLGDDGETAVKAFEKYQDPYQEIFKNVMIGGGIILVCVAVSVVSKTLGAYTINVIFSAAAKAAAKEALLEGGFAAISAGIVEGIKTKDFKSALQAAATEGSKAFKWGAMCGVLEGGVKGAANLYKLKGTTLNGLSLNDAAKIQSESKWSTSTIKQIKSVEEYNVYKNANLKEIDLNGQTLLVKQDIDLNYVSTFKGKQVTNLERMELGGAPVDATGKSLQLHHIGQKNDGVLAMLTADEHQKNASILNVIGKESEIDRNEFNKYREEIYQNLAKTYK